MWASIFRMTAIAESFTRLRFPCRGARKLRIPRIENHGILYHSPKTVCKTTGSYVEISGASLRRNCLEGKVDRLPDHFIVSAITPVGCFGSIPYLSIASPVYAGENMSLSILAWEEPLRSHSSGACRTCVQSAWVLCVLKPLRNGSTRRLACPSCKNWEIFFPELCDSTVDIN